MPISVVSPSIRDTITFVVLPCMLLTACDRTRSVESGESGASTDATASADTPINRPALLPHEGMPTRLPSGEYVVQNGCPGEYCSFGLWTLSETVRLRSAPTLGADSIGAIPALREVCADSGLLVIDPPGIVVIGDTAHVGYDRGPRFAVGDTVIVFNYESEGSFRVQWRDTLALAYAHWNDSNNRGAKVIREVRNLWWVHLTDRQSGQRGWILRAMTTPNPSPNSWGFTIVDGAKSVGPERRLPCAQTF
jgi:hypothetical protein